MNTINRTLLFLMLLVGAPGVRGASVVWEAPATHGWRVMRGATALAFDSAHVVHGTEALKLRYATSVAETAVEETAVESMDFLAQTPGPLEAGFSLQVYTQAVGAASGQPALRLELVARDGSPMAGTSTPLVTGAWTEVRLSSTTVTRDFKRIRLVLTSGGATGSFDVWLDALRRDDALLDDFERGWIATMQLTGTEGSGVGNLTDCAHLAQGAIAPPGDGAVFGMQWTGDDGAMVIRQGLKTAMDLRGMANVSFDLCVPAGSALPTIGLRLGDGTQTWLSPGTTQPSVMGRWNSLSLPLTGLASAAGINAAAITQIELLLQNAGPAGRAYLTNVRLRQGGSSARDWQLY